jgi:hypothetical protein
MVLVILEVQVRSDPNRATDLKASRLDIHDSLSLSLGSVLSQGSDLLSGRLPNRSRPGRGVLNLGPKSMQFSARHHIKGRCEKRDGNQVYDSLDG